MDQGREATGSNPTERCGEKTVTVDSSAQLGSVLQTSHCPEFSPSYTGPTAYEERSFTDLVTLGCGVIFRSAPGSRTATYENHETEAGESNGKPACEVAKEAKPPAPTEMAGNPERPHFHSRGGLARIVLKPGQPTGVENFFRTKPRWWVSQVSELHLCQSRRSPQNIHRKRVSPQGFH